MSTLQRSWSHLSVLHFASHFASTQLLLGLWSHRPMHRCLSTLAPPWAWLEHLSHSAAPKMGVLLNHPFWIQIFHCKASSYGGTSNFRKPPYHHFYSLPFRSPKDHRFAGPTINDLRFTTYNVEPPMLVDLYRPWTTVISTKRCPNFIMFFVGDIFIELVFVGL